MPDPLTGSARGRRGISRRIRPAGQDRSDSGQRLRSAVGCPADGADVRRWSLRRTPASSREWVLPRASSTAHCRSDRSPPHDLRTTPRYTD